MVVVVRVAVVWAAAALGPWWAGRDRAAGATAAGATAAEARGVVRAAASVAAVVETAATEVVWVR